MSTDGPIDPDFANLPSEVRVGIEALGGVGLHHVPECDRSAEAIAAEAEAAPGAFGHPEKDSAGTPWEPDWEPIDTYGDGDVVMLDDGSHQILGRREMGMWMECVGSEAIARPDFQPMLWAYAPEQVLRDMM